MSLSRTIKRAVLEVFWAFTRCYLRIRGAKVGVAVRCNGFPFIKVEKGGQLILEDGVQINASPRWNAHVVTGSTNFFVGSGAILKIGKNTGISGSRIVATRSIIVGNQCMIGAGCLICDSDMHEIPLHSGKPVRQKPIKIGDSVFIGAQSILLKGVDIGSHATIGAGSVVSKPIKEGETGVGNPVRALPKEGN